MLVHAARALPAEHPLAAGLLFAEAARIRSDDPTVLIFLGSSLVRAAQVLPRAEAAIWAARIFHRVADVGSDADREHAHRWLQMLEADVGPQRSLRVEDLEGVSSFLGGDPETLPRALDALDEGAAMFQVMAMGSVSPRFLSVLLSAVEGRWGASAARAALKRIVGLVDRVDVQASLSRAADGPLASGLEPYLSAARRGELAADWDLEPPGEVADPEGG